MKPSVTTVTPETGLLPLPDISINFGFAVAASAGGSTDSKLEIFQDESSGDVADETDEYSYVDIKESSSASGMTGFSFWIAGPEDESADENSGKNGKSC